MEPPADGRDNAVECRPLVARRMEIVARDENGVALIIVLICVGALTIATAALSALVTSNTKAFGRDRQTARAFNVAEAGLNYAVSRLTTYDPTGSLAVNSTIGSSDVPQLFTLDGGSGNGGWWAEKIAPTIWTIHARAISPNGSLSRQVAVNASTNTTVTNFQASLAWGYGLFVASPGGCTSIVGNAAVTMPVFIKSDVCFQGSSGVQEPNSSGPKRVTLYVGGKLTTGGGATVGTSSRKIISATIVGGCNGGVPAICSNSSFSKVYADTYSSAPSSLTKPPLYLDDTYDSGDWSHPDCSVGTFTFDNDDIMNKSVSGFTLFPSQSYDCTVKRNGNVVGRLAWNASTEVLTVSGLLFVDGSMTLSSNTHARYVGEGAIYVNGAVTTNGNSALCGPGATVSGNSCTGLWDATQGALGIVATGGWKMTGTAEFNVLAYVVGDYDDGGNARVTGPIITDTAKVHGTSDSTDDTGPAARDAGRRGLHVKHDVARDARHVARAHGGRIAPVTAARHASRRPRLADEAGELLLELVIALIFLTIAVGALMSVFTSSMVSLRDAGISGTAQTLVERQMEVYKKLPYASLKLSAATVPPVTDMYRTSPPATVSVPFTLVTGGTIAAAGCSFPADAKAECARQVFSGPDGRIYRVDSYIVAATPPGGRPGLQITVTVRQVNNGVPGSVKAETTSAFDPASPPS